MTLTCQVQIKGETTGGAGDMLAAFVNGECRGVAAAQYVASTDKYIFYLVVFSNNYSGEQVSFKYFNKAQDRIYTGFDTLDFNDGVNQGTVSDPANISKGKADYALTLSDDTLSENLPAGTTIGNFIAYKNSNKENYTVALLNNTDNFTIDNNSLLSAVPFDFETKQTYTLQLAVFNADSSDYFTDTVQIDINDVMEASDFSMALSSDTVSENLPAGTAIGTLSGTWHEAAVDFSYVLVNNTGNFVISGDTLYSAVAFDYEQQSDYQVEVAMYNADSSVTYSESFTVSILDKTEVPDGISRVEKPSVLEIYPNPVNDVLYIESESGISRVRIYTASGTLVKEVQHDMISRLDVCSLPAGIYVIEAYSGKERVVGRFMK